jgi:hypothetical protein
MSHDIWALLSTVAMVRTGSLIKGLIALSVILRADRSDLARITEALGRWVRQEEVEGSGRRGNRARKGTKCMACIISCHDPCHEAAVDPAVVAVHGRIPEDRDGRRQSSDGDG